MVPQTSIRVDANLVVVPVTVKDRQDRPITGLDRTAFHVFEDKLEQKIVSFSSEDAPLSVGIVFDCSGSMSVNSGRAREAVAKFLDTANPDDEFFLVAFSSRADLVVPFTTASEKIRDGLNATQSKGQTALLDAIHMSLQYMKKARNGRRVLLVVSDGGDNHSRYSQRELNNVLREADVWIYAIGIYHYVSPSTSDEEIAGPTLLTQLAEQTGGRELAADFPRDLPKMAATIGRELRNEYVLGFSPTNHASDGKYHHIKVTLQRHSAYLSWRPGYYSPAL
jgi:VWFA-related protein